MLRCSGPKVTDAMIKATFYRIEWWPNESQIVQAAHTVIACCSMTLEQRRIICVGIKEPQQYQGLEFLPRNLVASGKFHHGRGRTSMYPSVLLMGCLLSLYCPFRTLFCPSEAILEEPPAERCQRYPETAIKRSD